MDVGELSLATGWTIGGWVLAIAVLAAAVRAAPWRRLVAGDTAVVLPGAVFVLVLLWSLRGHLGDSFAFHLLGAAGLMLAVGPPLALVAGSVVVGVMTLLRQAPAINAGLVYLSCVAIPVGVAFGVLRFCERFFPPNFFVYVFACCFLGAALAYGAGGLAAALVTVGAAGRPIEVIFSEHVPFLLYLAFAEATLTGMCLTLAVVYYPHWVATFDDARYLQGR